MKMPSSHHKRAITVATACMSADGTPDFALTTVAVSDEEAANGRHYELADAQLLDRGYEEPFVHFGEGEGPAFLLPAVREYLGLPPAHEAQTNPILVENR
jgi:hypothetical protein